MTIRTSQDLKDEIRQLIDDNTSGGITPDDVRNVFIDMVDSYEELVANADTGASSGVSAYAYYAAPTLTAPAELESSATSVSIPTTGDGLRFTLLDSETFRGQLTGTDFITEWEGSILGRINNPGTLRATIITEHTFNGKTLNHSRFIDIDVSANTTWTINLNNFNSRSRVRPGTYSGLEVDMADLNADAVISYKLDLKLFERRGTDRTAGMLVELHSSQLETVSYQLRQARQAVVAEVPGQRVYVQGRDPTSDDGKSGDVWLRVDNNNDERFLAVDANVGGTWVRLALLNVAEVAANLQGVLDLLNQLEVTVTGLSARTPTSPPAGDAGHNVAWATDNQGTVGWRKHASDTDITSVSLEAGAGHHLAEDNKARLDQVGSVVSRAWYSPADAEWAAGFAYIFFDAGVPVDDADFVNFRSFRWTGNPGTARIIVRMPRGYDPYNARILHERFPSGRRQLVATYPGDSSSIWGLANNTQVTNQRSSMRYYILEAGNSPIEIMFSTGDQMTTELATNQYSFPSLDHLQHLTRDLHETQWHTGFEDAADADGDLYQTLASSATTLTDANFDNAGASIAIPDGQNGSTYVYVRLPADSDHTRFRLVIDGVGNVVGNNWAATTGPTPGTYSYWNAATVNSVGGATAQLQRRDAVIATEYHGKLAGAALTKSRTLYDHDDFPDVEDHDLNDIVFVNGTRYWLSATDEDTPNLFSGIVGRSTFNTTSGEHWRGVSTSQHPNGFSTDGGFTANPDNALSFLLASSQRHIRWGVKKSVFETAKGSAFANTDKMAIKITFPDSSNVDEAVGAYYNQYSRNDGSSDIDYLEFQHRNSESDGNYHLFSEDAGDSFQIEFFTVDGMGAATTTAFLTHVVNLPHWLEFVTGQDERLAQWLTDTGAEIRALSANVKQDIDDLAGATAGAALVTALPDPDTYSAGTKVILTQDVDVTVGNKTEVKFGRGVYGLADKPEPSGGAKKWMSFILGSGPEYRGFAEGFAGVTSDRLGDNRPKFAYPPDFGNAVVSPLGDAIVSFREHRGLVATYDVAILAVKKSVYYELIQEIHGSSFGSTTSPSLSSETFNVRMIRTDTGAAITNAAEEFWFSRSALSGLGDTVIIAGVEYYQLYYNGDTDWFGGIPDGTTCLLTLEYRDDANHHTFDTSVSKAWSRLDRHNPTTNEIAVLAGKLEALTARVTALGG